MPLQLRSIYLADTKEAVCALMRVFFVLCDKLIGNGRDDSVPRRDYPSDGGLLDKKQGVLNETCGGE
ncbi:MAG TPA: hypothetical protein EYN54_03495 [Methylococcaceae bacterium]|nr:hypothetical protein [Methylococcaceae bacterium]HIA44681.1 hypothetical protein [Methylococcaceae bacterium]